MKPTCTRVVVVSGNERQKKSSLRLKPSYTSPNGRQFELEWLAAGYDPTRRALEKIVTAVASADVLLISPRVGKINRAEAIAKARRHGVIIVQLHGSGTGSSGVIREAGHAVDSITGNGGEE